MLKLGWVLGVTACDRDYVVGHRLPHEALTSAGAGDAGTDAGIDGGANGPARLFTFSPVAAPEALGFWAIAGAGERVFLLSSDAVFFRSNDAWTQVFDSVRPLHALHVTANEVHVASDVGVYSCRGNCQSPTATFTVALRDGARINGFCASPSGNVFAVGTDEGLRGVIYKRFGDIWQKLATTNGFDAFMGCAVDASESIFIAAKGHVVRFVSSENLLETETVTPGDIQWHAVHSEAGDTLAVGEYRSVARRSSDGTWKTVSSARDGLEFRAVTSAGGSFIVAGKFLNPDMQWMQLTGDEKTFLAPVQANLHGVWAASDSEVWAVGQEVTAEGGVPGLPRGVIYRGLR